jgi:hypothetical protein
LCVENLFIYYLFILLIYWERGNSIARIWISALVQFGVITIEKQIYVPLRLNDFVNIILKKKKRKKKKKKKKPKKKNNSVAILPANVQ